MSKGNGGTMVEALPARAPGPAGPTKILLVDDEAKTLLILTDILALDGYEVVTARDGKEALARVAEGGVRAIITDIRMPALSGIDLLERIRERDPDLPVIIVTGYATIDTATAAVARGAFAYLMKPVDFDVLKRTLKKALERFTLLEERVRLLAELTAVNHELGVAKERLEAWNDALEAEVARRGREVAYQRDLLENVVATIPTALAVFDGRPGLLSANAAWRKTFGPVEAKRGAPPPEVLRGPLGAAFERALAGEATLTGREIAVPVPGAGPRLLRVSVLSLDPGAGGEGRLLLLVEDETDAARLEESLIQAEKMASLGMLAGQVVHDLNNPLAAILGSAEMIQQESSQPCENVTAIIEASRHMREVIAQLSQLAGRGARNAPGSDGGVDSNALLKKAVTFARFARKLDEVDVRCQLDPGCGVVRGSATELLQVFINLIANAGDALAGMARRPRTLEVVTVAGASETRVEIRDDGPGIAEEVRRRLFEPFVTTKPAGKGTGLGLYIARRIVGRLGGRLECDSQCGVGTTFTIHLPVAT